MIKYLLLAGIVFLMYRGIVSPKQIPANQEPDSDDFTDYEEL